MKRIFCLLFLSFSMVVCRAQLGVRYDPTIQSGSDLQYFRPKGDLFVGDCMPFFKDGQYSLYWLLDSAHHRGLNGLGGHQWVVSTTRDLKHWKQEPIVLGIDEEWEKSICTGSVVFYKGQYYAFYATRLIDNGKVNEQLSYAVSKDGVHFEKQRPNPFYTSAPGYSKRNFRDPYAFVDGAGVFHLFVASEQEDPVIRQAAGCLVHLSSKDLKQWTVHEPILTGQPSVPECPDYFLWNGWYYLVYSDNGNTFYVKSRSAYGPWEEPRFQALNEDWSNVVKTAAFTGGRRIAAAWIPSRDGMHDDGHEIFGGNIVFRELSQQTDGTLGTRFPAEVVPARGKELPVVVKADLAAKVASAGAGVKNRGAESGGAGTGGAGGGQVGAGSAAGFGGAAVIVQASGRTGVAHIEQVPMDAAISFDAVPSGLNEGFGLYLRSGEKAEGGYRLSLNASSRTVTLGNTGIAGVEGLDKPVHVTVIMKGDIIDVDIDGRRTIVNRCYDGKGDRLWFYAMHGKVSFSNIRIYPLKNN